MTALRPAVFLDRDGVLNEPWLDGDVARGPRSPGQLVLVRGAAEEMRRLREARFFLVAVTNQPDVAAGLVSRATADEINARVAAELGLDAVYMCPHDGAARCSCRKPKPGMLLAAARDHHLDLARSWLIGDRWVDVMAGRAADVRSLLLERPYSWRPTSAGPPPPDLQPLRRGADLRTCVRFVLDSHARAAP